MGLTPNSGLTFFIVRREMSGRTKKKGLIKSNGRRSFMPGNGLHAQGKDEM